MDKVQGYMDLISVTKAERVVLDHSIEIGTVLAFGLAIFAYGM